MEKMRTKVYAAYQNGAWRVFPVGDTFFTFVTFRGDLAQESAEQVARLINSDDEKEQKRGFRMCSSQR